MADQPKTGPAPMAPDAVKQPEKTTTTESKPVIAATAPPATEPKKI